MSCYWAANHEVCWLFNPTNGLKHLSANPRPVLGTGTGDRDRWTNKLNIRANFPGILGAINSARVNQFAGGLYPEMGTGQQAIPAELRDLLIENYRMMQEVRDAHQRPALVSFQSLRDRQDEYNALKSKTTIE